MNELITSGHNLIMKSSYAMSVKHYSIIFNVTLRHQFSD